MSDQQPVTTATQTDRRQPVARYVEFGDEAVQNRFIGSAEGAYQMMVKADTVDGVSQVELRNAPTAPDRRGLFRRSGGTNGAVVPTTAAIALVAHTIARTPVEVAKAKDRCAAAQRVAQRLATVANELLHDLLKLDPAGQAAHPAYRQTLRLAAELQGLRDTITEAGCTDPYGCVGIRTPEKWGRRVEDVEVAEVRAVLLQIASIREDALA